MIRRLGIFCFYDKNGIVDQYVKYLLNDICNVLEKLIIVVNGNINHEGKHIFKQYTQSIIIRENKGFDGGAYADIIVNYLGEEYFKLWDEIVLFNDTFYGPFVPFSQIFDKMLYKQIDFWGLNYFKNGFLSYIESYFLVFRKKIIQEGGLYFYLKNRINIKNEDITYFYAIFEHGLFNFLVDRGYIFGFYSEANNYNTYTSGHICIEKNNLPILKKKSFDSRYYNLDRQIYILKYIQNNYTYNVDFIIENASRLYDFFITEDDLQKQEIDRCKICDERVHKTDKTRTEIKDFFSISKKIYIYGAGMYARFLWYGYKELIKDFGGFVISDSENMSEENLYGYPVKKYSQLEGEYKMIIGLNYDNSLSVKGMLKNEKDVLFLWSDI